MFIFSLILSHFFHSPKFHSMAKQGMKKGEKGGGAVKKTGRREKTIIKVKKRLIITKSEIKYFNKGRSIANDLFCIQI